VWFSLEVMEEAWVESVLDQPAQVSAVVVGAPGSGKTTLVVNRVVALVQQGISADDVLIITPSRTQATQLRDRVGLALNRTTEGPRVRSMASFAFALVQSAHANLGLLAPDLLQASQIDSDIQALLAGHEEDGSGPLWPEPLGATVRETLAFRQELREWMARATENGLDNDQIVGLATKHNRPEWAAAAEFRRELHQVSASGRPAAFDSAEIIRRALVLLEDGLPTQFANLRHICVDDGHDVTTAGLDVVRALRKLGVGITVVSEPDVAGNTFRGSEPSGLHALARDWGLTPVVLSRVYRHGPHVRRSVNQIASRIGTAGMGMQRQASSDPGQSSSVFTLVAPGEQREANDIARLVQHARLVDGIPTERIAVVARRGRRVDALVRELGQAGIPARGSVAGSAVRDQPAARELLDIVALGRGIRPLTSAQAIGILTGRYGRMSQQDVRRLRFQMRVAAESDRTRNSEPYTPVDALIAQALGHRGGFTFLPEASAKDASMMAEVLDDIRQAGATQPVTEVLWSVVASTGVIDSWRRQALRQGPAQAGAHRALDSLLALFQQAQDFVEAQPGASIEVFLDAVVEADVPDDVVLPEPAWPAVTVATPPGVAGQEFDLVIISSVNDGVWPDLRLRGSLLSAHTMVRASKGEADDTLDERKIVQDDELRLFVLALSRATTTVVVTAVESEDAQPSPLFRMIEATATPLESRFEPPLSLRATTGSLRHELVRRVSEGFPVQQVAHDLALLASWGTPGAHPDSWWGTREPSSSSALYADTDVPISPSTLATLEDSPVEWFLGTLARHDSSPDRGLGSLIHRALEDHPEGNATDLWESVERKFGQLDYEAGWIEQYHRRIAQGMVGALADYLSDRKASGHSLVSSEQVFHLRHDRSVITGYIDRIERDENGALIVVDLKTGQHSTDSQVSDNPQMLTYQLALETTELLETVNMKEAVSGGAALLFVKSGVRGKRYRMAIQEPIDDEARASVLARIEKAAETISQPQFRGDPLSFGPVGTPSKHRWHFIGQVCGDV